MYDGEMGPESLAFKPPTGQVRDAVGLALRAPSLHNTQPWRWRLGSDSVQLYADPDRHLGGTDPDRRDLLISCGAALHHLHVALAGYGLAATTERVPDPEDSHHLATVELRTGPPDPGEAELLPALRRRRTDRRPYADRTVAEATLAALCERAHRHGADLHPVLDPGQRAAVDDLLGAAADAQRHRPGYLAELMTWTRRYAGAHDGVPVSARLGRFSRVPDDPNRHFPPGRLVGPAAPVTDGSVLLVVTTRHDDRLSRLRAGEATSAVLLAAVSSGLATAPLSQALELPGTRLRLAHDALHRPEHPQMVIRIGHPPDERELPETPRRSLAAVLMPT